MYFDGQKRRRVIYLEGVLILLPVLLFAFYITYKRDIIDSVFLTVLFLLALWLNVPVFIDISNLKQIDSMFLLQFRLYDYNRLVYAVISNLVIALVLYLQSRIANRTEFRHFEVKREYDS